MVDEEEQKRIRENGENFRRKGGTNEREEKKKKIGKGKETEIRSEETEKGMKRNKKKK